MKSRVLLFKNKKMLLVLITIVFMLFITACGKSVEYKPWPSSGLATKIPKPEDGKFEISIDSNNSFYCNVYVDDVDKQFEKYVSACKELGYTVEAESRTREYRAYNSEGYKIRLFYFSSEKYYCLYLDAPDKLDTIVWPKSDLVKTIPVVESTYGVIHIDKPDQFSAYIGNISKDKFNEYINKCIDAGYKIDYIREDTSFKGSDSNGNTLEIKYRGFNVISISLKAKSSESSSVASSQVEPSSQAQESSQAASSQAPSSQAPSSQAPSSQTASSSAEPVDGNLTVDNCEDLKKLLASKEDYNLFKDFATKYSGKTIEFDGSIDDVANYKEFKTKYNVLVSAGKYSEESQVGPTFKFENVSIKTSDMNFGARGQNVHIIAKVLSFDSNTGIFFLSPESVQMK